MIPQSHNQPCVYAVCTTEIVQLNLSYWESASGEKSDLPFLPPLRSSTFRFYAYPLRLRSIRTLSTGGRCTASGGNVVGI